MKVDLKQNVWRKISCDGPFIGKRFSVGVGQSARSPTVCWKERGGGRLADVSHGVLSSMLSFLYIRTTGNGRTKLADRLMLDVQPLSYARNW